MDRAERTAFISVLTHGGLVASAAALALVSGSAALTANAWLLTAGLAGTSLAWAGRRFSRPLGRPVVPALLWNLIVIVVGVGLLVAAVWVVREVGGRVVSLLPLGAGASVATAVAAYLLGRREAFVGREADDRGLIACGRHSWMAVAGSSLAAAGALAQHMGLPLDRAASLVITGLVGASGVGVLASAAQGLRGGKLARGIFPVSIPEGRPSAPARGRRTLRARARKVSDALFHPAHRRTAAAVAGGALLLAWAVSSLSFVGPGRAGIIAGRAGTREVGSGVHAKLPWPFERTQRVSASGIFRVATRDVAQVPGEPSPTARVLARVLAAAGVPVREIAVAAPASGAGTYLTGDGRLAAVCAAVEYTIADPSELSATAADVDGLIAAALRSQVAEVTASMPYEAVVATGRRAFEASAAAGLSRRLNDMELGVRVRSVRVVEAGPPPEAAGALARASASADEAELAVLEETGAATRSLSAARLGAARAVRAAEAYGVDRVSRAEAEAARFRLLAPVHLVAPDVTETRLYIEAMQALLPDIEKTVVCSGLTLDGQDPAAGDRAIARSAGGGR